jgi:hypothetical protein
MNGAWTTPKGTSYTPRTATSATRGSTSIRKSQETRTTAADPRIKETDLQTIPVRRMRHFEIIVDIDKMPRL